MTVRIRIAPRAGRQIRAAMKWWIANRTAAPTMLADELESAYALISDLPLAGEAVPHSQIARLRRVLLGRTRYHLYYVVADQSTVEILSLWHTSRGSRPPL